VFTALYLAVLALALIGWRLVPPRRARLRDNARVPSA
jgi:hypothetical protein